MNDYDHIGFDAVSDNAADFSKALMAMAEYTTGSIEKVVRKTCIDLYSAIVERTPVRLGNAKASWSLGIYHGDDERDNKAGYSESEINQIVDEIVAEFKRAHFEDEIIIYNNREYIERLENGSSQQAPYGMVAVSLSEFEAMFNNAVKRLGGIVK